MQEHEDGQLKRQVMPTEVSDISYVSNEIEDELIQVNKDSPQLVICSKIILTEGIWSAGQVVGLINDIPTVADLMKRIVQECEETIQRRLNNMLVGVRGGGVMRSRL